MTVLNHQTKSEQGAVAFWSLSLSSALTELLIMHYGHALVLLVICYEQFLYVFPFLFYSLIHLFNDSCCISLTNLTDTAAVAV